MTTGNLRQALRNLRHLYEQMIAGHVGRPDADQLRLIRSAADGLLSPAIADIEVTVDRMDAFNTEQDRMGK